ncbi:MAG: DUF1957 domain-containing protein [Limnochordaceae bacterium]|nr:DUF1957 domain-containing protein [Limnochordaceae bacterium]
MAERGRPVHLKAGEPVGYVALLLHAHLPFLRHVDLETQLEEDWLYEAITETYIPLLNLFLRLRDENVPFQLAMSLTPPLMSMLADPLLMERYERRLHLLIELAEKEVERTRWQPQVQPLAQMYLDWFRDTLHTFTHRYQRRLLPWFASLHQSGHVEIVASAATHGYLPLMDIHPEAVRAQVLVGVETFRRLLGQEPGSLWLPESGYTPVVEPFLVEAGIRSIFLDSHGLLYAQPRPRYAVYAPIYTPNGVACFGRDWETSKQVWSADEGYPGDPVYREFYRDIGWDLDFDYLRPYLRGSFRHALGIKYHRITGRGQDHKEYYQPAAARQQAAVHAGNFLFNREHQAEFLRTRMDRPPIIFAPYDAELFGHWWFEGPAFLEYFLRKAAYDQMTIATISPSAYLAAYPRQQVAIPSVSSWGYKGYHEVWLEGANDWLYRHLHHATERLVQWANRATLAPAHYADADPGTGIMRSSRLGPARAERPNDWTQRALDQAARELLLAQSSDWAFILKTGTVVEYARRRFAQHIERCTRLLDMVDRGQVDPAVVAQIERQDEIFPWLDYRVYSTRALPAVMQHWQFTERTTGGPYVKVPVERVGTPAAG